MTREDKIIAMQQRKKEFDGKFYIAVKTTGIVCLPSCPAQPLPKNVKLMTAMKMRSATAIDLARDANQIYFLWEEQNQYEKCHCFI